MYRLKQYLPACAFFGVLLVIWQGVSLAHIVPGYMLPSPVRVVHALFSDFPLLMRHLNQTLAEAGTGLGFSIVLAFFLAIAMDRYSVLRRALMPVLLLTQTVPTIAIAPLLVLWLGYDASPKIVLVFLTCFFPMTVALSGGFAVSDTDSIRLLQSMGASKWQIYRYIKIPSALPAFFSGLKIASSYSIIGAVVAEWLGGNAGLGVYMTRVRKSYSFDKMFACLILVASLSLLLMKIVTELEKLVIKGEAVKLDTARAKPACGAMNI
jgi:ABC-type nitrate/sulfonate/bicarbonate transport system permease component